MVIGCSEHLSPYLGGTQVRRIGVAQGEKKLRKGLGAGSEHWDSVLLRLF